MKQNKARLVKAPGPEAFLNRYQSVREAALQTSWKSSRIVAEFEGRALQNNYEVIRQMAPQQGILPMVKANAYGHGATWAARQFLTLPQLYALGVATLQEGLELRQALGPKWRRTPIVVFSETSPFSEEIGQFCEMHGLTASIATERDWNLFFKFGWTKRIPYHLQFNTGMNRLGIAPSYMNVVLKHLKTKSTDQYPQGIFSHLAMSEFPNAKLSQQQLEQFRDIRKELGTQLPSTQFHLANSAGIWNFASYRLRELTDIVRPGLALYGVPPWRNAPARGILPVMTLKASVVAVHRLKPGDSIGYGGTYQVTGSEPIYAAILGAGYADGIKRELSNQGYACLGGKNTRFLGTVSMDLSAVEGTQATQVGDWAELIGPQVDPWAQAAAAGTIPYELLTSVSSRVERVYDSEHSNSDPHSKRS